MLGHIDPASSGGEGDRRGDVEGICTITTGAAGVDHGQIGPGAGKGAGLAQDSRHGRQLIGHHPLGPQSSQERPGLHGLELFGQPGTHESSGLIGAEVVALQQMVQATGPGTRV